MKEMIAICLAAGQGKRMGTKTAKQFLDLKGRPILYYSLKAFEESCVDRIVLVTSENNIAYCQKEIVDKYNLTKVTNIVAGGKERYHSVYNALCAIGDAELVLVHDGARPFVDNRMIDESCEIAREYGAAIVGMPVKDTIKVVNGDKEVVDTPNRSILWQIQTPQTFRFDLLKNAYENMMKNEDCSITDDSMVMEKYGDCICHVVEGDYRNIKITTPEDLILAEALLQMN